MTKAQIVHAHEHREAVRKRLWRMMLTGRLKYIQPGYYHTDIGQENTDTWKNLALVVTRGVEPLCLFQCNFTRIHGYSDIETFNLTGKPLALVIFSRVMVIDHLFQVHGQRKVLSSVFADNPARPLWERLGAQYGSRLVGCRESHFLLPDGTYSDLYDYEITRERWERWLSTSPVLMESARRQCEFAG